MNFSPYHEYTELSFLPFFLAASTMASYCSLCFSASSGSFVGRFLKDAYFHIYIYTLLSNKFTNEARNKLSCLLIFMVMVRMEIDVLLKLILYLKIKWLINLILYQLTVYVLTVYINGIKNTMHH